MIKKEKTKLPEIEPVDFINIEEDIALSSHSGGGDAVDAVGGSGKYLVKCGIYCQFVQPCCFY